MNMARIPTAYRRHVVLFYTIIRPKGCPTGATEWKYIANFLSENPVPIRHKVSQRWKRFGIPVTERNISGDGDDNDESEVSAVPKPEGKAESNRKINRKSSATDKAKLVLTMRRKSRLE